MSFQGDSSFELKCIKKNQSDKNEIKFKRGTVSHTYGYVQDFTKTESHLVVFLNRELSSDEREQLISAFTAALGIGSQDEDEEIVQGLQNS